jgi:hypothetical protein
VSILAAVMGNPVRIGSLSVPGPEGAVERAVIGVVGAICVAAILPVVLINRDSRGEPFTVANATTTSEPPVVTRSPSPTPSPTPPVGPSAVAATPGIPAVTSIAVGQDAANGCLRTFTATVRISSGTVNVRYRVYVNGSVVGDPNRTRSVSGIGARPLDTIAVTATHGGAWTVRVDVLGPNPSVLTGTAVWNAPIACNPPPPPTSPPPTLSIGAVTVSGPLSTDACGIAIINVSSSVTVGSAPSGLDVTYDIQVDGKPAGSGTPHVTGSVPLSGSAELASVTKGQKITVTINATAAGAAPAIASQDYTISCT